MQNSHLLLLVLVVLAFAYYFYSQTQNNSQSVPSQTPMQTPSQTPMQTPNRTPTTKTITIYNDQNFTGPLANLGVGDYNTVALSGMSGDSNNRISSVKVPSELKVLLYMSPDFTGTPLTLTADTPSISSYEDRVRSIRVIQQ